MFKKVLLSLLVSVCFLITPVLAQQQDEQLASQYFQNAEWEKAAGLYEKLLNKSSNAIYYYDNLLKSYLELKDQQQALKLIKKQSKRFPKMAIYCVDQAYVYHYFGDKTQADEKIKNLINTPAPQEQAIQDLARAFTKRQFLNEGVQTYLKGRDLLKSQFVFGADLASLYTDIGENKLAIEEWVQVLGEDPSKMEEIQGLLQSLLQNKIDFENCKAALLKQYKLQPNENVIQDMLVWFYVQKSDYPSALQFSKKLDKKLGLQGRRVLELGLLAISNLKYEDAILIFQEVCNMGNSFPFYYYAKQELLNARTQKLLTGNYDQAELLIVEDEYLQMIAHEGDDAKTRFDLAVLQCKYLHNYQAAILNYSKAIQIANDKNLAATCKLALADVYIITGEVWESMLLYGQVDKDFMEEPLGQEAKLKAAKLSYYLGEFDWAKAQLDVLKTATTQLIANNAMELSLLIQENTIDSNQAALKFFAKADLLAAQDHFKQALSLLDSLEQHLTKNPLLDDILYKRAEISEAMRQYDSAYSQFNQVFNRYSKDILADQALFKAAQLLDLKLNNPEKAMEAYALLIKEYPGSVFSNEARKRYRLLRGDQNLKPEENTK
jgi:tetratricopeptide (TPR) repeat protein